MGIDGARGMNSQILVVEFRGVKGQYDTWAKKLARERPGQVQPEYELYLTREWCCMPDVSSCRERLWRSMKGTLMALPKGVSHLDSYDRRTLLFGARALPDRDEYGRLVSQLWLCFECRVRTCNATGTKEGERPR